MLAGRKETREVPHEPGATIEFRTLSGRELDEAERVSKERSMALVKGFDQAALQAMQSANKDKATETDPKDKYDADTLILYGVVQWSIAEPCDAENKGNLDAQTREWCVSVIVEMNVRPKGEVNGSGKSSPEGTSLSSLSGPIVSGSRASGSRSQTSTG